MTESWDEPAPTTAELPEIKLFGKWSSDEVQVSDISLTVSIVLVTRQDESLPHHFQLGLSQVFKLRFLQWWGLATILRNVFWTRQINCYKYRCAKNLYSKPESCVNKNSNEGNLDKLKLSSANDYLFLTIAVTEDTNEICQEFVDNKIIVVMIGTCPL